jgi:hypothetical protein
MSAPSMSMSSPRCSPRVTIVILDAKSDSVTSTSCTSAVASLGAAVSKAFRRPMMIPRSL